MSEGSDKRVLVVGGSGILGRTVAEAFARQGFGVRVMARDRQKLAALFGDRFEIAAGDVMDPAVVDAAVAGCWGVHLCMSHMGGEAPAVEVVLRAAEKHDVQRISYVSGTSARPENAWFPMIGDKLAAEALLESGRIPWTVLRPTWIVEAVLNFFQHGMAVCFGRGDFKLRLLASEDLASVVARAYTIPQAEGRTFRVLGPEPIRLTDAIERVRAALHPDIPKVTHIPLWAAPIIAFLRGKAGKQMAEASSFVRYFEKIDEGTPDPDTDRLLGPCKTTFDAWLGRRRTPA